jgi:hypothetical protein
VDISSCDPGWGSDCKRAGIAFSFWPCLSIPPKVVVRLQTKQQSYPQAGQPFLSAIHLLS